MKVLQVLVVTCASLILLTACGGEQTQSTDTAAKPQQTYKWKMVTSWPKNFPGLGQAPENFAKYINAMSAGRLQVTVYGAGEIVPGFEVFDAVSQGTAEMGHSGSYYWKGKMPAAPLFGAVPFGMTATEVNAWLHYGGGVEMWTELYAPFGVIPLAGGNTGVQMAGWFQKEINSLDDIQGLKMRIPGLGGEVFREIGGLPVALTGGEIFTALQTGAIDATEWVGPYNDLAFGFHQAAKYYYHTGWHEPGSMLEFLINEDAFNALPSDLQAMVRMAARAANQEMLDEYIARNNTALQTLLDEHNVELRAFPPEVMSALQAATVKVLEAEAQKDPTFAKVYASYREFLEGVKRFHGLTEQTYLNNRK
jgi:TRAP-type mannitol/chloroaromatic compound transport system substrate-binding protein